MTVFTWLHICTVIFFPPHAHIHVLVVHLVCVMTGVRLAMGDHTEKLLSPRLATCKHFSLSLQKTLALRYPQVTRYLLQKAFYKASVGH